MQLSRFWNRAFVLGSLSLSILKNVNGASVFTEVSVGQQDHNQLDALGRFVHEP